MHNTKNDLSSDYAKVDFQALVQAVEVAFCRTRNEISSRISKIQGSNMLEVGPFVYLEANWIKEDAIRLASIAETYVTLKGAEVRSRLEIVNKPEVKKEE